MIARATSWPGGYGDQSLSRNRTCGSMCRSSVSHDRGHEGDRRHAASVDAGRTLMIDGDAIHG